MELVQYRDSRRTKIVDLKSIEWGKVEIYLDMNVGQQNAISSFTGWNFDRGINSFVHLIKDWNLAGEDNQKLPIDKETLEKVLSPDDFILLTSTIAGITPEEFEEALKKWDQYLADLIKKNMQTRKEQSVKK